MSNEVPSQDTFRVAAAACGENFVDPIAVTITETTKDVESRPGTRLSAAITLDEYGCEATVEYQKAMSPLSKTQADTDLTFTLLDMSAPGGGSTVNGVVSSMQVREYNLDTKTKPHVHTQKLKFNAGDSENLNPISFGA